MAQDLREMFKKEAGEKTPLKSGHEQRFLNRLEKELPTTRKSSYFYLRIAASVLILLSIGIYTYKAQEREIPEQIVAVEEDKVDEKVGISFGDLSPDLKKVENYYVSNINLELSRLEVSEENKAMVDDFMSRLSDLNTEYNNLNKELNEVGPNDQTIAALIKNLQLRLQLLHKLKQKLNELKSSKNEQITSNTV